jgi:hypothetical protein
VSALELLPEPLALCRLAPDAPVPAWAWGGPLASVTRTPAELSVVCAASRVPAGVAASAPWRALRVDGPLDLSEVGVLAALLAPLAAARVSVFAIATYDTDYLLVREEAVTAAVGALRGAGHVVREEAG